MKLFVLILAALLSAPGPGRVTTSGSRFVLDGKPFEWRGITAFRLTELVATGKQAQAAAFMDWAAAKKITVLRVLTMAKHLFELTPEAGRKALPTVLEMAAARGLHVEVVALADSGDMPVDLRAHVAEIGRIAARYPNAFVEIANEPFHPTQHASLHDRATLAALAALIPDAVLVAYGSDTPENSGGGDYVTVHMPRGEKAGDHVRALDAGAALVRKYGRPVVSDEPIGAAAKAVAGRRDNSPARFRAAAKATRAAGMYGTFHYEGGLHARIPRGVELACFNAWVEGLRVPRGSAP